MSGPSRPWHATITVTTPRPEVADWLASALAPESSREVPRASASIGRAGPASLSVSIDAADAGAMRAALNTYLGWVELSLATVAASEPSNRRA
ncbi:MAG TPA: KEOPS complex subunit Pcc1 [Thermoplasmata archaeon]|nr:KEOPS complex subunit Pcc1 [Thermoplasmata archaeon]